MRMYDNSDDDPLYSIEADIKPSVHKHVQKFPLIKKRLKTEDPLDEVKSERHSNSFMRKYVKEWEYLYPWIRLDKGGNRPMCIVCMQLLGNQKSHLVRHEKTVKHQDNVKKHEERQLEEFIQSTISEPEPEPTEYSVVSQVSEHIENIQEPADMDFDELQRLAISKQFELLQQQMDLVEDQRKLLLEEEKRQIMRHEKELELLKLKRELLLREFKK